MTDTNHNADLVAAIDLGSNSFHMIVARLDGGQLSVMDRMRERVRLGSGLDADKRITPEAERRALECLERFGERVRDMPDSRVRAVGTNTLRIAKNGPRFLEHAHQALGHPIEIIAGREEARLIYLGVIQTMPKNVRQRLVVDIGGGSTECVIGERHEIVEADSLFMGCVSYSQKFFGDQNLTTDAFDAAKIAAKLELQPIAKAYRAHGWEIACGCSGTVHAIKKIARANGWTQGSITARVLKKTIKRMVAQERIDRLDIPGLAEDRKPVIAGGVAILSAIFDELEIEELVPAPGALREGALYDLVGRIRDEDVRDRTISWFTERYRVDLEQAARVERTALLILRSVAEPWKIDLEYGRRVLSWASHLFEIGLTISHTGYHKHSAYVVANADMAGFSRDDQAILAAVIRGHRRKVDKRYFEEVPAEHADEVLYYTLVFRLATLFARSRTDENIPLARIEAAPRRMSIVFPPGWLDAHPMSRADLQQQVNRLARVGFELSLADAGDKVDEKPKDKKKKKKKKES